MRHDCSRVVEGGEDRVLEGRVLHRLAQVRVHAPRRREDALDTRRRGGTVGWLAPWNPARTRRPRLKRNL